MPEKPKDKNKVLDESMQRALAKVQGEMPDVKKISVTPSTSSMLPGIFMPRGADAVTNPFSGNVTYNPDMMQGQSPHDMEQILTHEMTHVGQTQNTPWYSILGDMFKPDVKVPQGITPGSTLDNPYYWRPREMEAYQAERNRASKYKTPDFVDPVLGTRDIMLPSPRRNKKIDTGPSFIKGK